jgi:hypothetical protein
MRLGCVDVVLEDRAVGSEYTVTRAERRPLVE